MSTTFGEKISWLLRYCSQHTSHDYMFDERVDDINHFNVHLGIENQILSDIEGKRVILLTGDAGDGKTRVLSNLRDKLDKSWRIINDFSELPSKIQRENLQLIRKALTDDVFNGNRFAIAANTGILLNSISKYEPGLEKELQQKKDFCIVLDFSKRNLAAQESGPEDDAFKKIFSAFFELEQLELCPSCELSRDCVFIKNMQIVSKKNVRDAIKILYHSLYLMGVHVTFRDLLSSLAYLITGGIDCARLRERSRARDNELAYYNNLFDYKEANPVLNAFSELDMAKKDIGAFDIDYFMKAQKGKFDQGNTLVELGRLKRRMYFEEPEKLLKYLGGKTPYNLLSADFLSEYNDLLAKLKAVDMLDSIDDIDETLQMLELGLNKISDPYCTSSQMVLYDSPPLTPKDIQLVYTVERAIRLLFCTPKFFFSNGASTKDKLDGLSDLNEFICVVFDEAAFADKPLSELPRLRIDYFLFREILFASRNTFRQSNAKLSENAHILSYTRQIFNMADIEKFAIVWINAKRNDARLQVSVMKPNAFSKDKNIKFQIS